MAKKTKKRAPKELTRKQLSRLERDKRMERILKWSVIAVTVVVVGILAYGLVVEKVIKARQSVATVNEVPITTAEFQARVRYMRRQKVRELEYLFFQQQSIADPTDSEVQFYLEYLQNNISDLQSQLDVANALIIGEQTLEQLIQEEFVRQEAERRGITVSSEELQETVEESFGYDRNPPTPVPTVVSTNTLDLEPESTPLPTPTPVTEDAFRLQYDNFVKDLKLLGISEQQHRSWLRTSLLLEKLQEEMQTELPTTDDQVQLLYLFLDDPGRANEVSARLDAGEDFQTLIDELQLDENITAYGGEMDWSPQNVLESNFDAQVADLAFSLAVGEHSQPIVSQDGAQYTIIQVLDRGERELDQYVLDQLGEEAFQEWLEGQADLVERGTYRDRVPTDP
ncbi:MAG: hypothetical protein GY832_45050 [Chloroflexi bacterium]|nr:hypothetical protein [Chloroflexota bacterium]